jgi:cytochrome P450
MVNLLLGKSIDDIPIHRIGATDQESFAAFQRDPMTFHLRAFRALGPVYRTWFRDRMWVVLAGPEANDFIWKHGELWSYARANAPFLEEMGPDHVTALDGAHHREKRTLLKPAFDQAPAMRYLPQFNEGFRRALAAEAGSGPAGGAPVELVKFWADTITRINAQTVARAEIPDEAIPRLARWEYQMLRGLFLDDARASYVEREEYRALKAHALTWLHRIVDERLANPAAYDDNFAATLRARAELEGGTPDRERLVNDLYLILLAGTDNTSNLINWALIFTCHAPRWLAALRAELDGWDGGDVMALSRLPTLKAILMETQRVRPGTFVLTKESVLEFEFGGYRFPAGTKVMYPNVLGHFLEEFYPDPFTFNPERFLAGGRFVPRTQGTFGGGAHLCLGRNHSLLQSPIAVAQVMKYYDVEFLRPPDFDVRVGYSGGRLEEELNVRLIPRSP